VVAVSRLHVDWTRCDGHGLCADLLPELLTRDEWGYPVSSRSDASLDVDPSLRPHAERAVDLCPLLALRLVG
jgi:ferredoxin